MFLGPYLFLTGLQFGQKGLAFEFDGVDSVFVVVPEVVAGLTGGVVPPGLVAPPPPLPVPDVPEQPTPALHVLVENIRVLTQQVGSDPLRQFRHFLPYDFSQFLEEAGTVGGTLPLMLFDSPDRHH